MADRRMFSRKVIGSDAFTSMPFSAQALYFQICMSADDEGFLNNANGIQRLMGASEQDLQLLLNKKFLIGFESGAMVVKHWKVNNYIAKDRFKSSGFTREKELIETREDRVYTLKAETECGRNGRNEPESDEENGILYTDGVQNRIQDVHTLYTSCVHGCIQSVDKPYTENDRIRNVDSLYTDCVQGCIQNVDGLYTDEEHASEKCTKDDDENCGACRPFVYKGVYKPYTQNSIDNNNDNNNNIINNNSITSNEEDIDRSSTLKLVAVDGIERKTAAAYCDENGVFLSATHYDELRDFYERGMTDDVMCYAVDKAVGNGVRSWSYIRAIIEGWCQKGIRNLEAAKADTAAFTARKKGGGVAPSQKKYDGIDPEEFMRGGTQGG